VYNQRIEGRALFGFENLHYRNSIQCVTCESVDSFGWNGYQLPRPKIAGSPKCVRTEFCHIGKDKIVEAVQKF
jgi:hypothetical protein